MAAGRRRGSSAPDNGLGTAAFRGTLLIVVAVLLGAGLLFKSTDSGGPLNTGGVPTRPTATTSPSTPTSGAAVLHNAAEVKVLVLNGVDPAKKIATPATDALKAANYTTLPPADAQTTVDTSEVYYLPGYQADAQAIAMKLNMPPTSVQALPDPLPSTVSDPQEALVVAVIGPDSSFGG